MSMDPPMSMNQHPPQNFTMIEHLKEIGVSYNEREQREILLDWQENGHLPACVLDQSIALTKTIFGKAVKPVKRRNFRYTLEEITALILYRVLIEEGIPRSLNVISRLTGVCQKKLWTMERVFCGTMSTVSASRASIWLPGLSPIYHSIIKKRVQLDNGLIGCKNDMTMLQKLCFLAFCMHIFPCECVLLHMNTML